MNGVDSETTGSRLWPPTLAFTGVLLLLSVALLVQWWQAPSRIHQQPVTELRGRVLINEAPASTLTLLPGIGPATAASIVDYRRANGRFTAPRQLEAVDNIGPVRRRTMRPWIVFETPEHGDADGIRLSRQR